MFSPLALFARSSLGQADLKKNGIFVTPGLVRMVVVKKPATSNHRNLAITSVGVWLFLGMGSMDCSSVRSMVRRRGCFPMRVASVRLPETVSTRPLHWIGVIACDEHGFLSSLFS
jgi:hypothetical protein